MPDEPDDPYEIAREAILDSLQQWIMSADGIPISPDNKVSDPATLWFKLLREFIRCPKIHVAIGDRNSGITLEI